MNYQLIIFDLDGTLLDTLEDLGEAVNQALERRGFPLHGPAEYRRMVGHGVRNLVTQALPEERQGDEGLIDECLADFKAYYTKHIAVHTRPYPGMCELLADLHGAGALLAVVSNKFQSGTEVLIRTFFPGIPFVAIFGNRPGAPLKPDPALVGEVLRLAGVERNEAVLVGDSGTDMLTARNGGIRGIAVSWGYRPMSPSPDHSVVSTADELRELFLSNNTKPK